MLISPADSIVIQEDGLGTRRAAPNGYAAWLPAQAIWGWKFFALSHVKFASKMQGPCDRNLRTSPYNQM
jgi:hypothetical protein